MSSAPIEDEQNLLDLVNRPNMDNFIWDDPFLLEDQLSNEEKCSETRRAHLPINIW